MDALEAKAGDANQDVKAAFARLQQARAETRIHQTTELRGPTASGMGGGMPVSPAHAGMLAHGKGDDSKTEVAHARIVVDQGLQRDPRLS